MRKPQSIDELIKFNIVRLECGKQKGTAFLIEDDKAITARHCIIENLESGKEIKLDFLNLDRDVPLSITAEVIEMDEKALESPVAILKIKEKIEEQHLEIGILNNEPNIGEQMKTFGYPSAARDSGYPLSLNLVDTNIGTPIGNSNWYFEANTPLADFEGYSGSPVVFSKYMVGVILKEKTLNRKAFSLDAVSNNKLKKYFETNNINYIDVDYKEIKKKEENYKKFNTISPVPVGIEVNCNNYERNMVIKASIPEELLNEIEEKYLKELDYINELKIQGKEDDAWTLLRSCIKRMRDSIVPNNKVLARFYYLEAIWYLEDKEDGANAQKYYTKAIEQDSDIDTRIFNAKKRLLEGTCCNVLEVLGELETTALLNAYLQICVVLGKTTEANNAFDESIVEPNHSTYYMMALINIIRHDYTKANEFMDLALEEVDNSPLYLMMKGVMLYWNCLPKDIIAKQDLLPVMFETGVVHIPERKLSGFPEIIEHYNRALHLAEQAKNMQLQRLILTVWIDSLSISRNFEKEIDELSDELLKIDPLNPLVITWKYKRNQDLSKYNYEDFEKCIKEDSTNRIGTIIALVNVCLGRKDKKNAKKFLSKYKYEFNRLNVLEHWYDLRIAASESMEDLEEIENSISKCGMDDAYKKRFKGLILERKNFGEELVLYAKEIYEETNQRIDLVNLVHSCDKFEKWDEMEKYSIEWRDKYDDELALVSEIKALLMQHKFKECQDRISEFELLYGYNNEVVFYKIQILKVCGKYEEAIELIEKLWDKVKTESVLILMAEILYLDGQEDEMILRLKNGASVGIRTPRVYVMLAENLKGKNNRDAKRFAKKAYLVSNQDKKIMFWCINILFDLGESAEASELLQKIRIEEIQSGENDIQTVRLVTAKEARKFMEQAREEQLNKYNAYEECQIPYHVFFDKQIKISFAEIFLYAWENNKELQFSPIYSVFGSRYLSRTNIEENINKEIILDYSTILLMTKLQVIEQVFEYFDKIWVAGNLFAIISQESSKALVNQPDLLNEQIRVKQACENLGLIYHDCPPAEEWSSYNGSEIERQDIIPYIVAKKYNLIWIQDVLGTELFNSVEIIPEDMKNSAIKSNEILQVLVAKHIISEETLKKNDEYDSQIRKKKIQDIIESNDKLSLLVDFHFLEMIYKMGCLSQVASYCELHVFRGVFHPVEENEMRQGHLHTVKECLEYVREKLLDYKEQGKMQYIPCMENEKEEGDFFIGLKECMHFSTKGEIPLVCDDRMVNSYSQIEKQLILSSVDIIELLHLKESISDEIYYELYKTLFDKTVCYIIPPFDYMKNSLNITSEISGQIDENIYLTSVRRYLHRITNPESKLLKTKPDYVFLPEIIEYMYNLQNSCTKLLKWIWEQDRKLQWKESVSNWLLNYYSEFGYYSLFFKGDRKNILQYQTTRIVDFVFKGICEIPGKENKSIYYRWLFGWMQQYMDFYPDMEDMVVNSFGEFVEHFIKSSVGDKQQELANSVTVHLILDAIKCMPAKFGQKILESPKMKQILEKYTYEIVALDNNTTIEKETFWGWIEQSIQAGKGRETIQKYKGIVFRVFLVTDTYHVQTFIFKWREKDVEKSMGYSIKGAYLYCKDKLLRVKGFNRITKYMSDENIKEFAPKLEKERNVENITSIMEVVESNGKLWREKISFIFNLQYENTFDLQEIFPEHRECFESILPVYNEKTWKYDIAKRKGENIVGFIELLIKLPIGGENGISEILSRYDFLSDELKTIKNWISIKYEKTLNPIELLNLAYLCDLVACDKTEDILFKILEIEEQNLNLYIGLLKYGWCQLNCSQEFIEISTDAKLVYCYYFAGEVYNEIICDQQAMKMRYNFEEIVQWLFKVSKRLLGEENVLDCILSEDIMSPMCINKFRLTYTGCCNFIIEKKYIFDCFDKIQQKLEDLYKINSSADLFLEMYLSDQKRSNYLEARYAGKLVELLEIVFEINGIVLNKNKPALSNGTVIKEMKLKSELSIHDFVFLYIISKDIVKEEWIEDILSIINSFSILVPQDKIWGKFRCILAITEQMPEDIKKCCYERFGKELKIVLGKAEEEQLDEILSMLEMYCITVNKENPFGDYLDIVDEATQGKIIHVNKEFVEKFMEIRFQLEPEKWERAEKLLYRFYW